MSRKLPVIVQNSPKNKESLRNFATHLIKISKAKAVTNTHSPRSFTNSPCYNKAK